MIACHHFTPVQRLLAYGQKGLAHRANLLCLSLALSLCCVSAPRMTLAQANSAGGSDAVQAMVKLFEDIDDLDRLRSLNPLKLSADQLEKWIAAITAARDAYTKATADLASAQVKPLEAEVREVKRKMLAGESIPVDLDVRLQKASATFIAARNKLDTDNLAALAQVLRDALNAPQIAEAVKLSKTAAAAAGKATAGTDIQWFNYYVKEVIIGYPRILQLLQEMRGANAPDAKTAKSG